MNTFPSYTVMSLQSSDKLIKEAFYCMWPERKLGLDCGGPAAYHLISVNQGQSCRGLRALVFANWGCKKQAAYHHVFVILWWKNSPTRRNSPIKITGTHTAQPVGSSEYLIENVCCIKWLATLVQSALLFSF